MANKRAFADQTLSTSGSMTQTPDAPEGGHTPGPWLTQLVETEGPDFGVPIIGDNLGGLVGYALPWPTEIESGDYSRVIANARLIAAAPELLEALEDAVAEISALREWVDRHVPHGLIACEDWAKLHRPLVTQTVLRNARAALTKARGPQ